MLQEADQTCWGRDPSWIVLKKGSTMTTKQVSALSESRRMATSEIENLRKLAGMTNLCLENGFSTKNLLTHVIEVQGGRTAWRGAVRPEGILCPSVESEPLGPWLLQSEVDTILEYIDHEREMTGDSVPTILTVSPAVRYLESCDFVSLIQDELVIREGVFLTPTISESSVITVRPLGGPCRIRTTFTYEEIRVEIHSGDAVLLAQSLWSSAARDLSWSVLTQVLRPHR
jgi:hypothetical protein